MSFAVISPFFKPLPMVNHRDEERAKGFEPSTPTLASGKLQRFYLTL